jgi:hypothetical protein
MAFAESGTCGDSLTWTLDDGTLTISGTGNMENYGLNGAPWHSQSESIENVVVENGVTSIGDSAFPHCKDLASVTIGNGVTSIGNFAFAGCESLASVTIPNGVTSIGEAAFYKCDSLESVTIPDSVTSIGEKAFFSCERLTNVTISDRITRIGYGAFVVCTSLKNIEVDSNNNNYASIDGVLFNKDKTMLIQHPVGNIGITYEIPSGVTSIGRYAFCGFRSLTSITIPNSVTRIGEYAFLGCRGLSDVYYAGSKKEWDSISIDSDNDNLTNALIHYNGLTTVETASSGTCGDNLTWSLDDGTLTISGTGSMENYGLNDAPWNSRRKSIESLVIENSVTSIGKEAFFGCESLTSVTIPDSVTSIGDGAFSCCISLVSVEIPNSVTSIGCLVFASCTYLKKIEVDSNNKNYASIDGVLFNKDKTTLVQYPAGKTNTTYEIPKSVTSIEIFAFDYYKNLTSITIPKSVTSIEDGAFGFHKSLIDVYYEGSKKEWKRISIGEANKPLTNTEIHYDLVSENSQSSRGISQKIAEFFCRI